MAVQTVAHIADVSFKNHFAAQGAEAPAAGKIKVNHNTFDVTFVDGKVNARFASGNWFTNMFRSSTLARFTQTLQTQYDSWIRETQSAKGFKDNPNVAAVEKTVDDCFGILIDNAQKLCGQEVNFSKDVLKAYAMPKADIKLDEDSSERLWRLQEGNSMPSRLGRLAKRLGDIATLARARNELTTVLTGTECNRILTDAEGYAFKTHMMDVYGEGKTEDEKKQYILSILDAVIDGFHNAVNGMNDKGTQLIDFLENFDGACIEAKGDNIQEYFERTLKVTTGIRSDESHNVAYTVTAEFNALADEVKAPFREAARKECEAAVRAECKEKNIIGEAAIEERIAERVETLLSEKKAEIDDLVEQKIETDGKAFLYKNLCGQKRPLTSIGQDENGTWTVTTYVDDKDGKTPIMKHISAFDIDKNFDNFVKMYKGGAVTMGYAQYKTEAIKPAVFATARSMHGTGVVGAARDCNTSGEKFATLVKNVKAEMDSSIKVTDEELAQAVKTALSNVIGTSGNISREQDEMEFRSFAGNYVTAAYKDASNDDERLVHLVTRRVEVLKGSPRRLILAGLEGKALRCAQMMQNVYKDKIVDVKKAQQAIVNTIKTMADLAYPENGGRESMSSRKNFTAIMFNGRLFSDAIEYDLAHRAAGGNEGKLHGKLNFLFTCMKNYGNIDISTFIHDPGKEMAA